MLDADKGWNSSRDTYRALVVETFDHRIGPLVDVFNQILAANNNAPAQPSQPPSPVEDWSLLLGGTPVLTGPTKWLAGSTGCDLFVRRQSVIKAPYDCDRVTFQMVPGGPMPIGEMVLYPVDKSLPVARFRHVTSNSNLARPRKGDPVARVYDPSMDMLHWPARWQGGEPNYPRPADGYQHLDLSLASVPGQLNPLSVHGFGGAGGDLSAYQYLAARNALTNVTLVARTPGPQEGMA